MSAIGAVFYPADALGEVPHWRMSAHLPCRVRAGARAWRVLC